MAFPFHDDNKFNMIISSIFYFNFNQLNNNSPKISSANGKQMVTTALRPNGIYGENEKKHLPRIADKIEQGVTIFKFGFGITLLDWCYVGNLVQVNYLYYL